MSHPSVRGVAFDGRYIILGPTDKGVWFFDPETERYRRPVYTNGDVRNASENDFIDHLAVMRNGDIVVAGRFHPYRIEANTYRMDFIDFPGDNSNMNAVCQDAAGQVWLGSHTGVFCLDERYQLRKFYPSEAVFCFLSNQNNEEMLVGTDRGLRRISLKSDIAKTDSVPTPLEGTGVTYLIS